jgi:hypothetical protein
MDQISRTRLDEITAKEPAALTPEDIVFLRARSSYLTHDQQKVFAEALAPVEAPEETPEEAAAEEPKKKAK